MNRCLVNQLVRLTIWGPWLSPLPTQKKFAGTWFQRPRTISAHSEEHLCWKPTLQVWGIPLQTKLTHGLQADPWPQEVHTHTRTHTHARRHADTHTRTHAHTHTRTRAHAHEHTQTHTHTHTHTLIVRLTSLRLDCSVVCAYVVRFASSTMKGGERIEQKWTS